jgi:hypothetical protein
MQNLGLDENADGCIIKKADLTLFVWVGLLEGGFGGWGVPQGDSPQYVDMPSKSKKLTPSCMV